MWWVAFTMLCACGRVHFDERSDARDVIADASGFAPTTVDYLKAPNAAAGDRFGGPVLCDHQPRGSGRPSVRLHDNLHIIPEEDQKPDESIE